MKKVGVMLLLILLGFILVALPDSNERLFSISKDHGPSLPDAIGLIIMLIPYGWFVKEAWKRRERVLMYQHSIYFRVALFAFGVGYGLVIASVMNDYPYWWIYGILLLVVIQIAVFYLAFK
jgi:hypothetical protein